jgi:hypothetical protein
MRRRAAAAMRGDLERASQLAGLADLTIAFAVRTAGELGLADHLAAGPLPVGELAARTGTDVRSLLRLLRALATAGVFVEVETETFGLEPVSELLRSDHPWSLRDACGLAAPEIAALAGLAAGVTTGRPPFEDVDGRELWEHLAAHPRESRRFQRAQRATGRLVAHAALPAYDWGGAGTIVDVGGGSGALMAAILSRHPGPRGVILDLPHVVDQARQTLTRAGVADRCEVVAGNFFDAVPAGHDVYVLSRILCRWDDRRAERILRNVRAAMRADTHLLVLDALAPADEAADAIGTNDLLLLSLGPGRTRTRDEVAELLADAGLALTRTVETAAPALVEATIRH